MQSSPGLTTVLSLLVKAKQWQLAQHLVAEHDLDPSKITMPQVSVTNFKEIEETGNWQFALHLLDHEGIVVQKESNEKRLSQLFNATLEACLKERQWEMAIKLFERDVTFQPAASTYKILMNMNANVEFSGLVLDCALKKAFEGRQTPKLLDVRKSSTFPPVTLAVRWWLQRLVAPELSQQRQWYKCSIETSGPPERMEVLKLLRGMGLWPLVHPNLSRLDLEVSRQDLPTLQRCLMGHGAKTGSLHAGEQQKWSR